MSLDIFDVNLIDGYREEMVDHLCRIHPEWDRDEVYDFVTKEMASKIQNPEVELDNNFEHIHKNASLLSVIKFLETKKPNIAGNGTFYKSQHEAENPTAYMLSDMLKDRKRVKKQMFSYDPDSDIYANLDRQQATIKININSYYGASGMKASAFFSLWSGPACTGAAQSVITTTETAFEGFFADNFLFLDMDDCLHWCKEIISQDYEIEDWVTPAYAGDVFDRLKDHFLPQKQWNRYVDFEILAKYLKSLTQDELTKIYYKNNLTGFIGANQKMIDLYESIFSGIDFPDYAETEDDIPKKVRDNYVKDKNPVKKYNSDIDRMRFMDPNSVPDSIKDKVKTMSQYMLKYVYDRQIQFDKIYRLKNFYRKTVVVVDTDSNMLNCGPWMDFTSKYVMKSDYGRTDEENTFIAVNTAAFMLTEMVNDILLFYGERANIPEEYRSRYNMKNEFLFKRLVVASVKKRYVAEVVLREGKLTRKLDVKGMDFIKAVSTDEFEDFCKKITRKYVVSDDVNIPALQRELIKYRDYIRDGIASGKKDHLPNATVKDISAYKYPWREEAVRGAYIWNALYPNNEIESSSKVKIAKLTATSEASISCLKDKYPDVYEVLINKVFHSNNDAIAKNGLSVLAIPANANIPEWAIQFIDYETIINKIMAAYNSVTDSLKIDQVKVGKSTSRRTTRFSNIVRF